MTTSVWCKTGFVGWHRWKNAPVHRGYLASSHRHVFEVHVEAWVTGNDRELEFHDLKDQVDRYIEKVLMPEMAYTADAQYSCEVMAQAIGKELVSNKIKVKSVTVSEDGECGATVAF